MKQSGQRIGLKVASIFMVNGGIVCLALTLDNDHWTAVLASSCLLFCNWLLCGPMGLRPLAPAVVYLNVLAVFHLGLVLPIALGIAVGPMPTWLRVAEVNPALLLVILAFGSFALGSALAARSKPATNSTEPESVWCNKTLYYLGLATSAVGLGALLWGIRELGFTRFVEATYFETYRLARTYDPRFFVTSLQLTPMGFYLALAAAPRARIAPIALAGITWAGMIFLLGFRGFALTPIAAGIVILSKRGSRLPRWVAIAGVTVVLVAIPISRQLRDVRLSERSTRISDIPLAPLEAIQEIGGSLRPLVHTIELMENESLRWGSTYWQALGQVLPNLSLEWQGDSYLPLAELPPSHWVSRLASPWNYQHYGGLGFSAVAEPYMNFGPLGVAVVFGLLGYAVVWIDRAELARPSQLACWGMVLGPLLWATRNGSGVFFRPALWGLGLVLVARIIGDSFARPRRRIRLRAARLHHSPNS